MDNDPKRSPNICEDILTWDYAKAYPRGYFQLIAASPPCTEYSAAKTIGVRREEELADPLVKKTLEVLNYFQPQKWWLETPRNGRLVKKPFVQHLKFIDVDYCRFEDLGYQKPTRFYGGSNIDLCQNVLCDRVNCPALVWKREPTNNKPLPHRARMGGPFGRVITEDACYIPAGVIEYVAGLVLDPPSWEQCTTFQNVLTSKDTNVSEQAPENLVEPAEFDSRTLEILSDPEMTKAIEEVRAMNISIEPTVSVVEGEPSPLLDPEVEYLLATKFLQAEECENRPRARGIH